MSVLSAVMGGMLASAGGGPATTLKTGLVCWHDLEEASGTRADAHGSYALTPIGTVGRTAMRNGYGSDANPSSYLYNGASPNLTTGDFTIAGVFRTSNANAGITSREKRNGSQQRQWLVTLEGGTLYGVVSTNGSSSSYFANAGSGLNDNVLHDFIFWRDTTAETLNIMVDGGTPGSVSLPGSTALFVGTDPGLVLHGVGLDIYVTGSQIDSHGIWNRMLDSTERGVLRNGGAWRAYADL